MSSDAKDPKDPKDLWKEIVQASASRVYNPVQPAPAVIRARARAATEASKTQIEPLMNAIMTAPFFLCSTHGIYDLSDTSTPCTVPPNTYLLEAQTIGDLTLTTIDRHIWTLLQGPNREAFFHYIAGNKEWFRETGQPMDPNLVKATSNLLLYKPGDTFYRRILQIGGGRTSDLDGSQRRVYKDMAFFRFNPATPSVEFKGYGEGNGYNPHKPHELLHGLRSQLVMNGDLQTTDCDLVDYISLTNRKPPAFLDGTPIHQDFRTAWPVGYDPNWPAIFVFSSCAAVTKAELPQHAKRWEKVAALQHASILSAWSMGLHGIAAGTSMPLKPRLTMNLRTKGKLDSESFVAPSREPQFFRENEDLQYVFPGISSSSSSSSSSGKRKRKTRLERNRRKRRNTRRLSTRRT